MVSPVPIRPPVKPRPNPDPEKELFMGLLAIDTDSSLFLCIPDFNCYFNLETANDDVGLGIFGLLVYSGFFS